LAFVIGLPVKQAEELAEYDLAKGVHTIEWVYEPVVLKETKQSPVQIGYIRLEGTNKGSADKCLKCPEVIKCFY